MNGFNYDAPAELFPSRNPIGLRINAADRRSFRGNPFRSSAFYPSFDCGALFIGERQ